MRKPFEAIKGETIDRIVQPPNVGEYIKRKPTKEILEGVVSDVLKSFGFHTKTNEKMKAKEGTIEVDVWASRPVSGMDFTGYISCKNWNSNVRRDIIDKEIGRISNLRHTPHLRVLVAGSITGPGKKAAEANGFLVIETGEKAEDENSIKIFNLIRDSLGELFYGMSRPYLIKSERLYYLKKAADEGYIPAMYDYAMELSDSHERLEYLKKAAREGFEPAKEMLEVNQLKSE